jgi:hypothetical protein
MSIHRSSHKPKGNLRTANQHKRELAQPIPIKLQIMAEPITTTITTTIIITIIITATRLAIPSIMIRNPHSPPSCMLKRPFSKPSVRSRQHQCYPFCKKRARARYGGRGASLPGYGLMRKPFVMAGQELEA